MFSFEPINLKIHCNTWNKDAHGLFDYESEEIVTNTFILGKGGKIIRNEEKNEVNYEPDKQEEGFFLTGSHVSSAEGCLVNFFNEYGSNVHILKKAKNNYTYNKDNITLIQNMIYYVISQSELKGIKKEYKTNYEFKPNINDIIRFGRVQFIVRAMKDISTKDVKDNLDENIFLPNDSNNIKPNSNKLILCDICNKKEIDSINNPILKICHCKKCPLFHLNCFKNEYIKKEEIFDYHEKDFKNGNLKIVTLINFLCPLCNEPYNPIVQKGDKNYNILPYTYDDKMFNIILESINFVKDGIYCMMIIIFYFPKQSEEYFLGRGHEATFKISDISISRIHARFCIKNGNIMIEDLGSKFGTLLLAKKNIDVSEMIDKQVKIQIGRTVIWVEKKEG